MPRYEVTIVRSSIHTTKIRTTATNEEEAAEKIEKVISEAIDTGNADKFEWELESDDAEAESVDEV